jgi:hypothetical protein
MTHPKLTHEEIYNAMNDALYMVQSFEGKDDDTDKIVDQYIKTLNILAEIR